MRLLERQLLLVRDCLQCAAAASSELRTARRGCLQRGRRSDRKKRSLCLLLRGPLDSHLDSLPRQDAFYLDSTIVERNASVVGKGGFPNGSGNDISPFHSVVSCLSRFTSVKREKFTLLYFATVLKYKHKRRLKEVTYGQRYSHPRRKSSL